MVKDSSITIGLVGLWRFCRPHSGVIVWVLNLKMGHGQSVQFVLKLECFEE